MFVHPSDPILIIYATQTNTSRQIASEMNNNYVSQQIPSKLVQIDKLVPLDLTNISAFIFITSTYFDGQVPDMAQEAIKLFAELPFKPCFNRLKYGVFGVGSSEYKTFCAAAIKFENLFDNLGCRKIMQRGTLDRAKKINQTQRVTVQWSDEFVRFIQPIDGISVKSGDIETIEEGDE